MHLRELVLIMPRPDCLMVVMPRFSSVENSVSIVPLFLFLKISLISLKVEQELLCLPSFYFISCFSLFDTSLSSYSILYILLFYFPRSNRLSRKEKPHDYDLDREGGDYIGRGMEVLLLVTKKGWFKI
jgi:hypothetical protein